MLTATIAGEAVSRRGAEYRHAPGARDLFDFLQTEEGLELIDPGTRIEEHRYGVAHPCERCAAARAHTSEHSSLYNIAQTQLGTRGCLVLFRSPCSASATVRTARVPRASLQHISAKGVAGAAGRPLTQKRLVRLAA
jgi:hypothetical protein